ncbi:uncharacterized protein LOC127722254, partial [Mytilus californianus]|uniref:uncharacterized protein LOC127722254 n=1 Tax=Mytilus californianus TaxID=6549 RepID=UPI00224528DA
HLFFQSTTLTIDFIIRDYKRSTYECNALSAINRTCFIDNSVTTICPVDRNTFVTSQSTHETRFHFQDFEYAGHPDSMFVHCNATFCKSNDYSSECEPQCKHSKRMGHHRSEVQNLNGPIEISDDETKILFTDKRDMFEANSAYPSGAPKMISMDIEGRKLYFRLLALSLGPAMDVLHLYFETKVLNGLEFYMFLNQHKHVLFHQFIPKIPCCECKKISLAASSKRGNMNNNQFNTLYEPKGQIATAHEHKDCKGNIKEHCLCQYTVKQQVSVDCMDISLLHVVIKTCCPVGSIPGDPNWLNKIKDIRNTLVHHGSCSIDMNEFEDLWKTLEDNVLNHAGVVALTHKKKVKTEIQKLKEETSLDHLKEVVKHSSENIQEVLLSKLEQTKNQYSIDLGRVERNLQEIKAMLNTFVQIPQIKDTNVTDKMAASCRVDDPGFDAEIMMTNNLNQPNSTSEEFLIKSIENKCVLLALEVSRLVLHNKEALEFAVYDLIQKIITAGNIDTKIKRTVKMVLIIKGLITKDELLVISAVLSPDRKRQEKALSDFDLYTKRQDRGEFKDEDDEVPSLNFDSETNKMSCTQCNSLLTCQNCRSKDIKIASLVKEISYLRPRLRRQESLICCQCCDDKEKPAFYDCKECDKYMCEQCNAKHNSGTAFSDHKSKYIDPLKYKVKDTFKIRGMKIRDIKVLNDELLVVADGKENKLITCRIDGGDRMETMLPMEPFRMAVTDVETVAVSFGSEMKVGLINVLSGESTNEFELHASCFAIAYSNMQLFVSCQEKTEVISDNEHTVHVISIHTGELQYKINLSDFTPENMLVGTDSRMYFTYYGNKFICTDMTGSKIFDVHVDNMRGPWGITFDNN